MCSRLVTRLSRALIPNFYCRTALHWACKRNHISVIRFLISNGADISVKTFNGESAANLASSQEAFLLLDCHLEEMAEVEAVSDLPIVPHYLKNPPFPYSDVLQGEDAGSHETITGEQSSHNVNPTEKDLQNVQKTSNISNVPLLLKLRVHESLETDFIEAEVSSLSYQALLETCAEELEIEISRIAKIRKLPDVLVRKDRDVQRMSNGQKLEVVLT